MPETRATVTILPYKIDPTHPDFELESSWTAVRAVHKAIRDSTLSQRIKHLSQCTSGMLEDNYSSFGASDTPQARLSNLEVRLISGHEPTAEESYANIAEMRRKLDDFKTMLAIALEVHFTLTDDTLLLPGDADSTLKLAPPPTRSLLDEGRWRVSTPAEMALRMQDRFESWPHASESLEMLAQVTSEQIAPHERSSLVVEDDVRPSTSLLKNATRTLGIHFAIEACCSDLRSLAMDQAEDSQETLRTDVLKFWTVGDASSLIQTQLANAT